MAETKSQKKASQKWNEKNRAHRSYLTARSSARGFIRNKATLDDLNELQELINKRFEELKKLDI
ncbi:hypothetical protein [Ligilactobacillus apodemi]|uniref:Uncharacterized protein n=1 Tax=Ligilactobacillus apodemi DSM 16634 = JCM 16172 TaxID=1423724 RepID=A0A0R1TZQ7_9LACO|nr:hypothetical protein [Ligilactobacillus apodemi]KRL84602.1 hypothetical protein FC32_GL000498 [Ligilactobacillus apodemi DSM 16634 = JCM 16172]MCR1900854.1 hypothetical protein [Ligilactobacillus apodemi]